MVALLRLKDATDMNEPIERSSLTLKCKGNWRLYNTKTIILPVVLYECDSWVLILREEHRLVLFGDKEQSIFGQKRQEVTGGWRKLHNEELHNVYSSWNIFTVIIWRRMRCVGHAARLGEIRNTYKILVGKLDGKSPPGRLRRWWDSTQMVLRNNVDWTDLAKDR
jgi:hypothetical protein